MTWRSWPTISDRSEIHKRSVHLRLLNLERKAIQEMATCPLKAVFAQRVQGTCVRAVLASGPARHVLAFQPTAQRRAHRVGRRVTVLAAGAAGSSAAAPGAAHLQLATARLPADVNREAFCASMFQWASTLIQNGRNLPFALPLKCDKLADGFQVGGRRHPTWRQHRAVPEWRCTSAPGCGGSLFSVVGGNRGTPSASLRPLGPCLRLRPTAVWASLPWEQAFLPPLVTARASSPCHPLPADLAAAGGRRRRHRARG